MRIGIGYDVHRLVPERKLILGGVEIPHSLGLLGLSLIHISKTQQEKLLQRMRRFWKWSIMYSGNIAHGACGI